MSAAIDIIHGALFKIGVHSEIKPVSNKMLKHSFQKFIVFVKELKDDGFDKTGLVVPNALADDVTERGGARNCIETLFACYIASDFAKDIKPQLLQEQSKAMVKMHRHYRSIDIPNWRPDRLRVKGQGNYRYGRHYGFRRGVRSIDRL